MDLNTFSLTARLGADPKMRYTSNETAVTSLRAALQVAKEKTLWLDVTVWGKQAENANKYLEKGSRVAITGRLDQDDWVGDDGKRRTTLKVIASTVTFLDTKKSGDSPSGSSNDLVDNSASSSEPDDDFPL